MAAILSAALLLRDQGALDAAVIIEDAVTEALIEGLRTPDIGGTATTVEVGSWLAARVLEGEA